MEPASRASAWRKGLGTTEEHDDVYSYNCVGDRDYSYLWRKDINGRCGICGDPWMDRPHKMGVPGKYDHGVITGRYQKGQNITVEIELVKNHGGYFMFRLCQNDNFKKDEGQECFNRY